jgi:hypothetical protein
VRRLAATAAVGCVVAWTWPGAAWAAVPQVSTPQSVDAAGGRSDRHEAPAAAAQRARVQHLTNEFHSAAAAARRSSARLTDDATLDTVRAGSLVLLVEPSHEAMARRAADEAWAALDAIYGSAAARLHTAPLVIRTDPTAARQDDTIAVGIMLTAGRSGRQLVSLDARTLRRRLVNQGTRTMRDAMDEPLRAWLGTYGAAALGDPIHERAYEALVTSPSRVARGCLLGDIAMCREALLLAGTEDRLERWYDAPRRRQLAQSRRRLRAVSPASYDACIAGDDAACDVALAFLPPADVPQPLPVAARQSLVHVAVELGGRDAFARLLQPTSASMDERLSAAAGMPSDSVLVAWRTRVMAAQPQRDGAPGSTEALALVWTAFFGFLATRSTRWR